MGDEFSGSENAVQPGHDLPVAESPAGLRFSLRSLFIATMTICILLALLVPAIRAARQAAQRITCTNNMKQIALALHNYRDVHKAFPWAITFGHDGTPMHSWRVAIVPYLDQQSFYDRYEFREAWNGPGNGLLGDEIPDTWRDNGGNVSQYVYVPPTYRCPSAPRTQSHLCTNYVMLIDDRPGAPNGPPNLPGSAPPSLDPISAVIVIEIADSDIHWMEPRDVLLSELSMKIHDRSTRSLSSCHGGACVLHADGTVEVLDDATTEERVRELLTQ